MREPLRGRGVLRREMPGADRGATFRYSYNVVHGALLSAGIGLLSSLLGIGGGVFQVPVMITLLRFPVHVATATSQFVLLFMSGEASAVHLANGDLAGDNVGAALLLSARRHARRAGRRAAGAALPRADDRADAGGGAVVVGGRLLCTGLGRLSVESRVHAASHIAGWRILIAGRR